MKTAYQKAKAHIHSLHEFDHELPWLLALDVMVIVGALVGLGVAL